MKKKSGPKIEFLLAGQYNMKVITFGKRGKGYEMMNQS
jgi:hypothetical protein